MDLSLEDIRIKLRALLPILEEKYGVAALWIFGSRVRHEESASSDLDLLVEFGRPGISLFGFAGLELELEDELGVKVDLVQRGALREEIRGPVLSEAVPI